MLLIVQNTFSIFSISWTDTWFCTRKSLPKIRGLVRLLHMMKSPLNFIFPNSKVQCTIPMGTRLLPVADLTLIFCMKWVFVKDRFCKYFSLIQLLVAPVSIKALHTEVPILVGKVVPCSDPIMTSSAQFAFGLRLSDTSNMISVSSGLLSNLSCSVGRKGISNCLDSHWSSSVKQFSLSSHSILLSWVASEPCSSFKDSSSIACNSSVISLYECCCMVCFILQFTS